MCKCSEVLPYSVGVDVDPQAIISARHNAALNNIEPEKMQLCLIPSKATYHGTNGITHGDMEG